MVFSKNRFTWKMFFQEKLIFMSYVVWYKINNFFIGKRKNVNGIILAAKNVE